MISKLERSYVGTYLKLPLTPDLQFHVNLIEIGSMYVNLMV
jgi:hypothetical protein